jgi:hypothetical protein
MAGIFENYRCEHHPDTGTRLGLAKAYLKGEVNADRARRVLSSRDRDMWLEVESSTLAGVLIEPLVKACPRKKFILTIRDPYSWADPWIDHDVNLPPTKPSGFAELDKIRQTLRSDRAWLFASPKKHRVLATLDAAYVEDTAERFCGTLVR